MSQSILLCTVGGSHQPILKAIQATTPGYVLFFCTGDDPVTGKSGSRTQVEGAGNVIRAHPGDEKPTLPNIPVQANLDVNGFEVVEVSADDLDHAFLTIRDTIENLDGRFPAARFVADYTGGTKTMTAALVCAVLESDRVELQLVAGARPTLDRVSDGTEMAMTASVARLRLDRAMAPYLAAWGRFAYREAADGLDGIRIGTERTSMRQLGLARALSHALASWDDFDHQSAAEQIEPFRREVAPRWPWMLPALRLLTQRDRPQHEPARLFDLWSNAQRRAQQGRFDDAVARVYRLIEWVAQWQLRTRLELDTADFPADQLPAGSKASPGSDGRIKVGLLQAWQVARERLPETDPVLTFAVQQGDKMLDLLRIRNHSMLAHGFRPVREPDWKKMEAWVREQFLPVLRNASGRTGLKEAPRQLPTSLVVHIPR